MQLNWGVSAEEAEGLMWNAFAIHSKVVTDWPQYAHDTLEICQTVHGCYKLYQRKILDIGCLTDFKYAWHLIKYHNKPQWKGNSDHSRTSELNFLCKHALITYVIPSKSMHMISISSVNLQSLLKI